MNSPIRQVQVEMDLRPFEVDMSEVALVVQPAEDLLRGGVQSERLLVVPAEHRSVSSGQ